MANETENAATLLAKKDYAHAVPLLKREHEKYQNNPRIRLQYADALAGNGDLDEAIGQYEATAKYYEDNGLTVQAIAVRKKSEKVRDLAAAKTPPKTQESADKNKPLFERTLPKSPLFEVLGSEELAALAREMELEEHDEGSGIISEGETASTMYCIPSREANVYTRAT